MGDNIHMDQATDPAPPDHATARRWAPRLAIIGACIFVGASLVSGIFGRRDGGKVDDVMHALGPLLALAFAGCGIGALVLSIRVISRGHRRSMAIWMALAFGIVAALFLLGEVLLPH